MHPYIVIVCDPVSHKTILSIPCAESDTAILVQKNLQSLFPQASISLQVSNMAANKPSPIISIVPSEPDFAELEEDLFNDVA